MPEILISGATGFVGQSFIKYSAFRNLKSVSLRNTDPEEIDFKEIDTVLHLAGIVHKTHGNPAEEYYRVNRDMSLSFASAAKSSGVKQFVFLSSSKVYGDDRDDFPLTEESACLPSDDYGKSKYEAEQRLLLLNDENFTVSIIRTPVVYGVGMKANMLNLIRLIRCSPLIPLGEISNNRNYTYIENLVAFIDRIIELKIPGVFIVKDNETVSTTELVILVTDAFGYKRFVFGMPRPLKTIFTRFFKGYSKRLYGSFYLDNSLTLKKLSFAPLFSMKDGIAKTISGIKKIA